MAVGLDSLAALGIISAVGFLGTGTPGVRRLEADKLEMGKLEMGKLEVGRHLLNYRMTYCTNVGCNLLDSKRLLIRVILENCN